MVYLAQSYVDNIKEPIAIQFIVHITNETNRVLRNLPGAVRASLVFDLPLSTYERIKSNITFHYYCLKQETRA